MKNLMTKYGYTEKGAKEVCIYVVDNQLAETFSGNNGNAVQYPDGTNNQAGMKVLGATI